MVGTRIARPKIGVGEFAIVATLALAFGLVGVDRFLIVTMFPVIARDLSFGYAAIGMVTGALSISWGVAALLMGNVADRIGRRPVLVGSMLLFSAMIGLSGLAAGLSSLILIRVIMGLADGAFTPASIAATLAASAEQRRGLNIGLQQAMPLIMGLGFAPLLVAWLLDFIDWRWIFSIFVVPGFMLALALARVVPGPKRAPPITRSGSALFYDDFRAVFSFGNIRLLMLLMLAWLTCLISISAFLPSYMLDHLGLSFGQMSGVMSASGFGGAVGTIALPALSDRIGRRPVVLIGTVGALLSLLALSACGPSAPALFACLFATMGFIMALITLTVGPLCEETVPAALGATASGVVIAAGELFGGGVAPMAVGQIAQTFGIEHILWLPITACALALVVSTGLRETRIGAEQSRRVEGLHV